MHTFLSFVYDGKQTIYSPALFTAYVSLIYLTVIPCNSLTSNKSNVLFVGSIHVAGGREEEEEEGNDKDMQLPLTSLHSLGRKMCRASLYMSLNSRGLASS